MAYTLKDLHDPKNWINPETDQRYRYFAECVDLLNKPMEDKRQKITAEISEVLKKYDVKGAFLSIILKGESSGKRYDDAFLLQGNATEIAKGIEEAVKQIPIIHNFVDLIVLLHTGQILEALGGKDLTQKDFQKHMNIVN